MRLKQLKTYKFIPDVRFPWSAVVSFSGKANVCVKINETKDFLCQQTVSCQVCLRESEGNVKPDLEKVNLEFLWRAHELQTLIRISHLHPSTRFSSPTTSSSFKLTKHEGTKAIKAQFQLFPKESSEGTSLTSTSTHFAAHFLIKISKF